MLDISGVYSIIHNFVYGFDYAVSYLNWIVNQPYFIAEGYIFGDFDETYFLTLIFNVNAYVPHLYVPIVSDGARVVFHALYGWIPNIYPNLYFGGCLIVGTICNVFVITIIHWPCFF